MRPRPLYLAVWMIYGQFLRPELAFAELRQYDDRWTRELVRWTVNNPRHH